jgi:hypothetical protein
MYQGKYDLCMMGFMPTTDAYTLETVFDPSTMTLNNLTDPNTPNCSPRPKLRLRTRNRRPSSIR